MAENYVSQIGACLELTSPMKELEPIFSNTSVKGRRNEGEIVDIDSGVEFIYDRELNLNKVNLRMSHENGRGVNYI